jgi:hypothetical protein
MLNGRTWGPLRNRAGVSLPDAVKERYGSKSCPCCSRRPLIWRWSGKPGRRTPDALATHAHDHAVARGGDPRCWFFACHKCNNDQGPLDLVTWARKLMYADDPRAGQVGELALFVRRWVRETEEEAASP